MSSSVTNAVAKQADPVGHAAIVHWIEELRAALKSNAWADAIDFEGIDALDVLLAPIYLTLLQASREGVVPPQRPAMAAADRIREWAYHLRASYRERIVARKSALAGATEVLLWSRDITHTNVLLPVAGALAEQGKHCRMLACHAKVFADLQRVEPRAVYTMAAWPCAVREARREGARRAKRLSDLGPWNVASLPKAPAPGWVEAVREMVINVLPLVSEAIANARAALDAFRPKVLVIGNDIILEGRAACRVAAAGRVPTAVFMHGNITADPLQALHCADRLLVFGELHHDDLVQQGIPPARIVVCGAPNLDHRPRQTGQIHPLLQSRLGLRPNAPWILVATSGPGHRISHRHHALVIEHLARLSAAIPEVPVVVKLHRKDRLEYYRRGLKNSVAPKMIVVPEDASGYPRDIFQWLEGCPIVLTGASTVAVEAMLMDVPVVTMDFCDEIHAVDFIDAGATMHVRTPEAMVETVREVIARGAPRRGAIASPVLFEKCVSCPGRAIGQSRCAIAFGADRSGEFTVNHWMRANENLQPQDAVRR